MGESEPITERAARVRLIWAALRAGELGPLEAALAPDARWRAVEDGPWNCESRAAIVEVMREGVASGRIGGELVALHELGERQVAAFRPTPNPDPPWPLEDGLRWVVVSFDGDAIVEIKGCAGRAAAFAFAQER